MAEASPFSRRAVRWLIAVGAVSFTAAAILTVMGDRVRSTAANAFSVSAIGHRAFVETLLALDVPVVVSRYRSVGKAGPGTVLVVAEPTTRSVATSDFDGLLEAPNLLYVLPKRRGTPSKDRPEWLESADWVAYGEVEAALDAVAPGGEVVRHGEPVQWSINRLGPAPEIQQPQLMTGGGMTPIVAGPSGVLVGEVSRGGGRIWILSDPDILANHGIGRGDNAALAVALIDGLRRPGGAVIFDETHHGFIQPPSLWRSAARLPFAIVTVAALVALAALAWSAAGRFGAPVPLPRPLISGKAALIDNAANLLDTGGLAADVFTRYVVLVQRDAVRRLHAPNRLDEHELIEWLDRIGRARGLDDTFAGLKREADALAGRGGDDEGRTLRLARRLNRWRREIIDGPHGNRDNRRAA